STVVASYPLSRKRRMAASWMRRDVLSFLGDGRGDGGRLVGGVESLVTVQIGFPVCLMLGCGCGFVGNDDTTHDGGNSTGDRTDNEQDGHSVSVAGTRHFLQGKPFRASPRRNLNRA